MSDDLKELAQRKLSFFQTLNPVHLIVAGIVLTVIFVVSLVQIAGWAIRHLT